MIIELLTDIRRLRKARYVRDMMIGYHEDRLIRAVNVARDNPMMFYSYEMNDLRMRTRERIANEEAHYKYAKGEIAYKWKKKLGIKEEYL